MRQYFDRFGKEIKAGMMLSYEWSDGLVNLVLVSEKNGDLGVVIYDFDGNESEFVALSTTDMAHARIKNTKEFE